MALQTGARPTLVIVAVAEPIPDTEWHEALAVSSKICVPALTQTFVTTCPLSAVNLNGAASILVPPDWH